MKFYKAALLSVALMGVASVIGAAEAAKTAGTAKAAETVKAVPGAAVYIYNWADAARPDAEADPLTVIVDKSEDFWHQNPTLKNNEETKKFVGAKHFIVWKGYIHIPAPGTYTFSSSVGASDVNVIIQLNGKDFLCCDRGWNNKLHASRSVQLSKGDYELTAIMKSFGHGYFELKMWDKKRPFKKTTITPAKMVHAE